MSLLIISRNWVNKIKFKGNIHKEDIHEEADLGSYQLLVEAT